MADSLLRNLRARGEELLTDVSNNLLANPAFIEVLKKGIAVKEIVDQQVAQALKRMNLATRKDLQKLEQRLAALESELTALKAAPPRARRPAAKR
ncbi:MAG: hypothetical protein EDX89_07960 [Acidobacteria bacterium]|nr:MAG: hypothetical protein EDX89_07960 [Acidobacteriota bacterium]